MQKARRHPNGAPTACKRTVSGSISLLCSRSFSPFLHSTGSLSVYREYLALRDGPRCFTQNSSCSALLRIPLTSMTLACTGLSPAAVRLSRRFQFGSSQYVAVLQPQHCRDSAGLGSSAFARHYSRNHCYFLLLEVVRCFSSLRSPLSLIGDRPSACRVAPFGNHRIKGHLHLPCAYRSLSRPSSPPIAKASTIRSSFLLLSRPSVFLRTVISFDALSYSCKSRLQ